MAKVTLNRFLEAFRGGIGSRAFRPQPAGTILPGGIPRSRRVRGRWLSPYRFARAECLQPPVIQRIERVGGCIRVLVIGSIWVGRVEVTVFDGGGSVLERGSATQAAENWWEYASFTEGKSIMAEAWDLPGNRALLALETPA